MQEKKGWNLQYELVTSVTGEEIERRLKKVTILRSQKNFFSNFHVILKVEEYPVRFKK